MYRLSDTLNPNKSVALLGSMTPELFCRGPVLQRNLPKELSVGKNFKIHLSSSSVHCPKIIAIGPTHSVRQRLVGLVDKGEA